MTDEELRLRCIELANYSGFSHEYIIERASMMWDFITDQPKNSSPVNGTIPHDV